MRDPNGYFIQPASAQLTSSHAPTLNQNATLGDVIECREPGVETGLKIVNNMGSAFIANFSIAQKQAERSLTSASRPIKLRLCDRMPIIEALERWPFN